MGFALGQRSRERLKGVDDRLVRVVERAIELTEVDFTVLEGLRTPERQKQLVNEGFSQTLKSKHLTGHAVDLGALVNGKISWDKEPYYKIEKAMKQAAQELNIKVRWGGDFKSFFDAPHWELV
jgi:peptidoglycan L-alanyl-D-glutamate endopeptidase CwlK